MDLAESRQNGVQQQDANINYPSVHCQSLRQRSIQLNSFRGMNVFIHANERSLIYSLRFSNHISVALVSFDWLRSPERIKFEVAVLMYAAVHRSALTYLSRLVHVAQSVYLPPATESPSVCSTDVSPTRHYADRRFDDKLFD